MTTTTKELLALVEEARLARVGYDCQPGTVSWQRLCEAEAAAKDAAYQALPALCAEVEALRKDAERYRWLRDNKDKITMTSAFNRVHGYGKFSVDAGTFDTLDAAIDAAKEPK